MYKVLRCILDEKRRGTRAETSAAVKGEVTDEAHKKTLAEKLSPALLDLEGMELFDKETGKIKIKNAPKPAKTQTAEEKMLLDFRKLVAKPHPQLCPPQSI